MISFAWRAAALAGLVVGLAITAPLRSGAPAETESPTQLIISLGLLAVTLALVRPRHRRAGMLLWLALVAAISMLAGLSVGSARLAAIDGSGLVAEPGTYEELRGTVVSPLRTSGEITRFRLDTPEGLTAVESRMSALPGPPEGRIPSNGPIDEGRVVLVSGTLRDPAPWERSLIDRSGASLVLAADSITPTGSSRGGVRGALDDVRRRAESALEHGTAPVSAALLRGFVLGQDDRIPEHVRDEFRRSGLAHVLAVSGQNVMLLAILATPLLALAGVPLRTRLLAIAAVIAIYVPVAGAGASIQRAGVMGIAGIIAALASRPTARWYALGVAAAVTLTIDPRATGDIGWQLSFAAVAGLLVLTSPLVRILAPSSAGFRRALAEGAAMTLAASLATAPLAAHHFGTVSLTAIPANLLALPAIAPAMWLGMLAGALGQAPGAPVEALTWLGGLCAGFIGWVAHVLGPEWAQLDVSEPGPVVAAVWSLVLIGGARLICLALERRRAMRPIPRIPRRLALGVLAGAFAIAGALALLAGRADRANPPPELTLRILDVGQGDAVLVQPRDRAPLLVDTGPPEGDAADRLAELAINRLFGIAITHDERDHSGALGAILERTEAERLLFAGELPEACEHAQCPPALRLAEGSSFRIGAVRIEALWPPPAMPPAENPNETALVLRVSYRDFDALLAADAEAEAAAYALDPVDLLKVAHHGSADAGLDSLLERTSPQLAAISVGAENPYGHPAPETIRSIVSASVPLIRTDEAGEAVIEVTDHGWSVGGPE